MSTKATAARIYEYGGPDVFRFETMDVPDPVGHEVLVQGCAEALESLVRDAGGPEGLYVNLAIQVEACAAVIADPLSIFFTKTSFFVCHRRLS